MIEIAFALALCFVLGMLGGMSLMFFVKAGHAPDPELPPPCKHDICTQTSFPMMRHLTDLFSGRITPEEYDRIEWQDSVTTCGTCGEELKRSKF